MNYESRIMDKKRYWLRGLIVGLMSAIIIGVLFLFFPVLCSGECQSLYGFNAFQRNVSQVAGGGAPSQITATYLLVVTILGAIIGWIYGKIKNRNSSVSSNV